VKYLHGIGTAGQLTLTTGALFHSDSETDPDFGSASATARYIPVLLGYRHNFNGLYVEPQLGYMSTHVSLKVDGQKLYSGSSGSFAYAVGGGYAFANGLDLGVSFRNSAEAGATGMIAFRVGYNFSLGGTN
ncbi:MAG TPA: outer membrane beta-barrel protein, partial [Flavisolibacter sp.]|nr:outer membrane beta-barrel protein [Flavisolibacter sp.]